MVLAYWCVFLAGLLPYAMVPVMRGKVYNNHNPRDFVSKQTDPLKRRALGAHQNSFEVFPFFAAAVIVAMANGMGSHLLDTLAVVWVALRVVYMWAYINDHEKLRSPVWGLGVLVTAIIFTMPAWSPLVWHAMPAY